MYIKSKYMDPWIDVRLKSILPMSIHILPTAAAKMGYASGDIISWLPEVE